VEQRGLEDRYRVDSAGTGAWHVGEGPDPRSVDVARRNGIALDGRARKVEAADLHDFDWVIAMDRSNLRALRSLQERDGGDARLALLRDFDPLPGDGEVPDPYYGGARGFDDVYDMVRRSLESFLDRLEEEPEP
jgi:protein-tyrosine phosphatase